MRLSDKSKSLINAALDAKRRCEQMDVSQSEIYLENLHNLEILSNNIFKIHKKIKKAIEEKSLIENYLLPNIYND